MLHRNHDLELHTHYVIDTYPGYKGMSANVSGGVTKLPCLGGASTTVSSLALRTSALLQSHRTLMLHHIKWLLHIISLTCIMWPKKTDINVVTRLTKRISALLHSYRTLLLHPHEMIDTNPQSVYAKHMTVIIFGVGTCLCANFINLLSSEYLSVTWCWHSLERH